jgi:hypothetical protein
MLQENGAFSLAATQALGWWDIENEKAPTGIGSRGE